jgi:hypothetical protein
VLVRCERCRAVFRVADPVLQSALECSRCHHVFAAPTADILALTPVGILGGAAAIAAANRGEPLPPPRAFAPAPKSGTSPLTTGLLGVIVLALFVLAVRSPVVSEPSGAADAARTLESAHQLVRRDDSASLESAIALLTASEAKAPGQIEVRSERATAMLLLGASLRAESDDLLAELSRSVPTADSLSAMSETDRTAALQKAASAREKLPALTARADDLIRDGSLLARDTLQPTAERKPAQLRALWLADAFDHRADRLQSAPLSGAESAEQEGWWHLARALAADGGETGAATEERELVSALKADASNLRAKWQLARLLLARTPPDRRAEALLTEVLAANPAHTGAALDRSRINTVVAAASAPGGQ